MNHILYNINLQVCFLRELNDENEKSTRICMQDHDYCIHGISGKKKKKEIERETKSYVHTLFIFNQLFMHSEW